jgi:alkylation response protein AidB-like acyl-CoA dehydrogenase
LAPLPLLGQQLCLEALVMTGRAQSPATAALVDGSEWASADIPIGAANFSLSGKGDSRELHGEAPWVLDDGSAIQFLTFATDRQGALHVLCLDAALVKRSPLATHDRTRSVMKVSAAGLPVDSRSVLASGAVAEDLRVRLLNHAALALAADCVGGAATALAITLDYLKERVQFGRVIGSFQALKHRAATMKIQLEMVRALLSAAVCDDPVSRGNRLYRTKPLSPVPQTCQA